MTEITTLAPTVTLVNGHGLTTSLAVAAHFGKRHNDVLRAIRNLEDDSDFYLRNFAQVIRDYPNGKGGIQSGPAYEITRDGFALLAMGFTGKEATKWKIAYINAFNRLEQAHVEALTYMANHFDQQKLITNSPLRPKPTTLKFLYLQAEDAVRRLRKEKDRAVQQEIYSNLRHIHEALGKPTDPLDAILSATYVPEPPKLF
jgi:Rha family phage regulatory protein